MAHKGDQVSLTSGGDENPNRGNWSNKCDFILSCLGYAVGLGNVWRFPYLAYSNGGGAFLVPYAIMLFFAGMPIFFFEVCLGQYSSQGPISVWRASPMFRGIGFGMVIVSAFVAIYYNVIITYAIYYMFASFTKDLPWERCNHDFNTENCTLKYAECLAQEGKIMLTTTCQNITDLGKTDDELLKLNIFKENDIWNTSQYVDSYAEYRKRPTEEYWKRGVLQESESMNETGGIVWELALCLLLAWILVFLCLAKGVKSSGKVVYFTATFPYAVLLALLIRVTLDGAQDGIDFFIKPVWDDITTPQVWLDAATQIFFSLSAAWGGLVTLSSYNRFHNNGYFDSVFVSLANCATSIFAGFAIFSVLGHVALEQNKPVPEVVDSGFGLAFIVYPEGLSLLPGSTFWAIIFFLMLITLGLDSQFVSIETVVTAICDGCPSYLRKRKTLVTLVVCILGYVLGLVCVTRSGAYWVSLVDSYAPSIGLIVFGLLELVAITWVYGIKRFTNDIRSMLGDSLLYKAPFFLWWQLNWTVITPSLLLFVLLYNWMNWSEPTYNDELYPLWGRVIGWVIIGLTLIFIPLVMIYEFLKASGSVADRWRVMSRPRADWGPQMEANRAQAWQMHEYYNTTMGGKREAPDTSRN
ncbi:sodium- and chloride-dependent neutral and basic amino acid transporter B(0+)-like [Anneissia japonica]|uniref:sodium- and chloride-dependent neutral and basic amino acid transporter B(0+)-like n=1 Tax=Anneissia japonica TaxID=1529436 RepID=UPI001425A738|nr:sodium- and chloride-dependent neutral and basic amino acid transporter B(0+)-like [Anneissia japonica]